MKNLSLALNGVLLVAVIALYYLHFSSGTTEDPVEEVTTEEVVEETEEPQVELKSDAVVGYVNIDSLQEQSDLYSDLINQLKASQNSYDRELNSKLSAFEAKKADFQKKAPTMSQFEGEQKYKELMKEQEELYALRDKFAQRFQEKEQKLGQQFEDELRDFIDAYNQEKKYDIIIGASFLGNRVLYFDEGINISGEVISGLNDQYEAKQAEKKEKKAK